jgi:TfoX/Sxy family transcriptional regulator of competence genes
MSWQKSSPELVSRFDACLPKAAGVERKQMFGYPCAHVNGNMFAGLHEQRLALRLAEQDRAALLQRAGSAPFEVMGRTMREYVVITNALERTPRDLSAWMQRALAYAQTLPAKRKANKA